VHTSLAIAPASFGSVAGRLFTRQPPW
jgi:hypothetical protein